MLRKPITLLLAIAALAAPAVSHAKLSVAASTTDLASIAASVGGDQVDVFAIARPGADPHRIEALPSYMVKVSRAKLYLKVGLGLDQWAGAIVDGSRNASVQIVDCSRDVRVLETEKLSGEWRALRELGAMREAMETWSQIVYDELLS